MVVGGGRGALDCKPGISATSLQPVAKRIHAKLLYIQETKSKPNLHPSLMN